MNRQELAREISRVRSKRSTAEARLRDAATAGKTREEIAIYVIGVEVVKAIYSGAVSALQIQEESKQ